MLSTVEALGSDLSASPMSFSNWDSSGVLILPVDYSVESAQYDEMSRNIVGHRRQAAPLTIDRGAAPSQRCVRPGGESLTRYLSTSAMRISYHHEGECYSRTKPWTHFLAPQNQEPNNTSPPSTQPSTHELQYPLHAQIPTPTQKGSTSVTTASSTPQPSNFPRTAGDASKTHFSPMPRSCVPFMTTHRQNDSVTQ